jgi:hypothetical protein
MTNSMGQNASRESDKLFNQEMLVIPHLLNLKFDKVHKCPPLEPILSQMNPVQVLLPCFLKTHFSISSMFACITKAIFTFEVLG